MQPLQDSDRKETTQIGLLDRFRKSWFPPGAVVGAFAAFVAAALRVRPTPKVVSPPPPKPADGLVSPAAQNVPVTTPARNFDRRYSQSNVLGGSASIHPFRNSLLGIAVGAEDRIYALGDREVRVFDAKGDFLRGWRAPEDAACLTVGPDERIYLGARGRVEIYDASGNRAGGFPVGDAGKPADVTSIKVFQKEVLMADAAARFIRRYDSNGKQLATIGTQNKTHSFILPNRSLDFAVDAQGIVRAGDTGRHRVTSWKLDGEPLGYFGKFGQKNPEDFTGCCNPVNLAVTPDGMVVTAEKANARVKVYEPGGRLLAVIGSEYFDNSCSNVHLAVDSKGRILTGDPVRREIKIFSLVTKVGGLSPQSDGRQAELARV
jgi:hypothetical protein